MRGEEEEQLIHCRPRAQSLYPNFFYAPVICHLTSTPQVPASSRHSSVVIAPKSQLPTTIQPCTAMAGPNPGPISLGIQPPRETSHRILRPVACAKQPDRKESCKRPWTCSSSHQLGVAAKFSAYPCCIHDGCVCVQDVQDPPHSTPRLGAKSDGTGHIDHPKRQKVSTKVSMSRISLRDLLRLIVQKSWLRITPPIT